MEIKLEKNGSTMLVALKGRLDSVSSPEMEKEVVGNLDNINNLTLDLKDLSYMSSAGLRVVLTCQKKINAVSGTMVVKHVNEMIMDIFEATGFSDILTIENDA